MTTRKKARPSISLTTFLDAANRKSIFSPSIRAPPVLKLFSSTRKGRIVRQAFRDFRQIYPRPGWVEHDPEEIWRSQLEAAREVVAAARSMPDEIAALGITNQRETTILWDRLSGKPIHNAIVWQCRRTTERCDELRREGFHETLKARTGLVTDAYFSGTKVEWILDQVEGSRSARGETGDPFRHGRFLADLQPDRRESPCHGLLECFPHPAVQHSQAGVG